MDKTPIDRLKDLIANADAAQDITAEEAGRLYDFLERLENPNVDMVLAGESARDDEQDSQDIWKAMLHAAEENDHAKQT